jgi:hypothetical protein
MIEIFLAPIQSVVNTLFARHDRKQDRNEKLMEMEHTALIELFSALSQTVAYVEQLPENRDRKIEIDLSQHWARVATHCRPFFEDDQLYWMWHKSLYWLIEPKLSEEDRKKLQIDLPTVQQKVGELIWNDDAPKYLSEARSAFKKK